MPNASPAAPAMANAGGAAEAIAERARAKGSRSTADPSVPSGNMFKMDGNAKRLLDDPYADLIKGYEGARKKTAAGSADPAPPPSGRPAK